MANDNSLIYNVDIKVRLLDETKAGLDGMNKTMSGLSLRLQESFIKDMGQKLQQVGQFTMGVVQYAGKVQSLKKDLEALMITSGKTPAEAKAMVDATNNAVDNLVKKYGVVKIDVFENILKNIRALGDLTPKNIANLQEVAVKMANALREPVGTMADALSNAKALFFDLWKAKNPTKNFDDFLKDVSNKLLVVSNKTKATGADLAKALGNIGQDFTNLGVVMEDQIAMFGALTQSGVSPANLATSMKNLGAQLSKITTQKNLLKLNIQIFDDKGKMLPMEKVLENLKTAVQKYGNDPAWMEAYQKIFNIRSSKGLNIFTAPNSILTQFKDLQTNLRTMGKTDMLEEFTKITLNSFETKFNRFQGQLKYIMEKLGEPLLDIASGLLDSFAPFFDWLGKFIKDNPTMVKWIASVGAALWAMAKVSQMAGSLGTFFQIFKWGYPLLVNAITFLGSKLPLLTKLVSGMGNVGEAVGKASSQLAKTLTEGTKKAVEKVKDKDMWTSIGEWFKTKWAELGTGASALWAGFKVWGGKLLGWVSNTLGPGLANVFSTAFGFIGAFLNDIGLSEFIRKIGDQISAVFDSIMKGIRELYYNIPDALLPENLEKAKYEMMATDKTVSPETRKAAGEQATVLALREQGKTNLTRDNWQTEASEEDKKRITKMGETAALGAYSSDSELFKKTASDPKMMEKDYALKKEKDGMMRALPFWSGESAYMTNIDPTKPKKGYETIGEKGTPGAGTASGRIKTPFPTEVYGFQDLYGNLTHQQKFGYKEGGITNAIPATVPRPTAVPNLPQVSIPPTVQRGGGGSPVTINQGSVTVNGGNDPEKTAALVKKIVDKNTQDLKKMDSVNSRIDANRII